MLLIPLHHAKLCCRNIVITCNPIFPAHPHHVSSRVHHSMHIGLSRKARCSCLSRSCKDVNIDIDEHTFSNTTQHHHLSIYTHLWAPCSCASSQDLLDCTTITFQSKAHRLHVRPLSRGLLHVCSEVQPYSSLKPVAAYCPLRTLLVYTDSTAGDQAGYPVLLLSHQFIIYNRGLCLTCLQQSW